MSERKDEQWLDSQLRRVIGDGTPVFNAQSWKGEHRREYETLLSRHGRSARDGVRMVHGRWIAGLAAAAVILLTVVLLIPGPPAANEPPAPPRPVADSAAGMMSMSSLRMAYEQGGLDGLDRHLQNTLDEFGPRSSSVSLRELF